MFRKKTEDGGAKNKKQSPDRVKKQSKSPEKTRRDSKGKTKTSKEEDPVVIPQDGDEFGPEDETPVKNISIEEEIERTKEQIKLEALTKEARMRDRLQYLEAMKIQKDDVAKRWPGKSFEVGLRLDWFAELKKFLLEDEDGDECKVLSTIDAIVEAYKSDKLQWMPGYVTYWSYGEQLTQPRPFDWEEFLGWNTKYKGGEGFWVEGLRDSNPSRRYWKRTIAFPGTWNPPRGSGVDPNAAAATKDCVATVKLPILFRILRRPTGYDPKLDPSPAINPARGLIHKPPGWYDHPVPRETLPPDGSSRLAKDRTLQKKQGYTSTIIRSPRKYDARFLWMEDDTGCDVCTIMKSDVDDITQAAVDTMRREGVTPEEGVFPPPLLGYVAFQAFNGVRTFQPIRALEINMIGEENHLHLKNDWDLIEVAVSRNRRHPLPPVRLLGPWLRHRFFTATFPDSTGRLWVFNKANRMRLAPPLNNTSMWYTGDLPGLEVASEREVPGIPASEESLAVAADPFADPPLAEEEDDDDE